MNVVFRITGLCLCLVLGMAAQATAVTIYADHTLVADITDGTFKETNIKLARGAPRGGLPAPPTSG